MAQNVRLVDPQDLKRNPENPRLIFRVDELQALQDSIKNQGILVPLTVYQDKTKLIILDGERRWRCALKLGLDHIPVIVQPKPTRLQNIMMMFAIHNARRDWDPLPTAYKLQQLEDEFTEVEGRVPKEQELAELASISRGEVRRLRKLLGLPESYRDELMKELEKPRSEQTLTVDHVLEATKGASALRKRDIINEKKEEQLRRSIIEKFRAGVIRNTVDPRKLARIARAVDRQEVSVDSARRITARLIKDPEFTIDLAFSATVEQVDFEHNLEQLVGRLTEKLEEHRERGYEVGDKLESALRELGEVLRRFLSR